MCDTLSTAAHEEEQEMEAQALSAIYESSFEIRSPKQWSILLRPVDTGVPYDPDDQDPHNHVAVQLFVQLTPLYPISETPSLDIVILRGLTQHHQQTLLTLAQEEASNNLGMPVVFAVCEAVKAWLMDHNQKGLDDTSMHAQMMRKKLEADKRTDSLPKTVYESHKERIELSSTEIQELTLRKRRDEGTPCTDETFHKWKLAFDAEMIQRQPTIMMDEKKEWDGRPTGYELFTSKLGIFSLDALERAADEVMMQDNHEFKVDEQLFDEDDLDDLDFDEDDDDYEEDEDEDYEDDDDEEVDI